jgi:hypothetical protein
MSTLPRSSRRIAAIAVLFWITFGTAADFPQVAHARASNSLPCPVNMRLLVIAADGNETVLPAIRETLDYLGTPYDLHIAGNPGELTAAMLSNGACFGRYQGIILTTGELGYFNSEGHWGSALSAAEWTTLRQYQANFKIRQATWYTYPQPQFGYNTGFAVDTSLTPVSATFTPDGAAVFSYLNTATPITITNAYTYLATPLGASVTPLLTDADGHALALIHVAPDGREQLSLTFDGNQHLLHSIALGYGMVRWVSRGVFLGERHVYMSPQVDDLLIHNDQWKASTPCGTAFENTGFQHRVTADDLITVLRWQFRTQARPNMADVKLSMAFNGYGAKRGSYQPDDLTPLVKLRTVRDAFHWISHTFTHENLDHVNATTTRYELNQNINMASTLRLTGFTPRTLVTPDVSGLTNATFLKTAYNIGVRYVVSDTSRAGYNNPSPNTGIVNALQSGIYMIPRYPNNLFFNVGAPADWAGEYNCMYRSFWGRDLSYEEIVDFESERLLTYLLKGDANPWMFHQTNLDSYDGSRTLLTDLLDATLAKYNALYRLPILSPPMHRIGALMKDRAAYNASGVNATWHPDGSITVRVRKKATIPITGAVTTGAELYGGQVISHLLVTPLAPITIPAP